MNTHSRADDFAALFKAEADEILGSLLSEAEESWVAQLLQRAELSQSQQMLVNEAMTAAIKDTLYSVLLALDGAASLGGTQTQYQVLDESGEPMFAPGDLEAAAWQHFHQDDS